MSIKNNYNIRRLASLIPPKFLRKDFNWYKKIINLIKTTEEYSIQEIEEWQFLKLKNIVNYAWDNVEGYRKLWQKNGFKPSLLKSLEDVSLIPFVTKEMIRDDVDSFTNKKLSNLRYVTTGGSTGIPFGFYQQNYNNMIEWAFIINMWKRFYPNIKFNTKRVLLRGDKFDGIVKEDPMVGLYLSSYDLNLDNVKRYIEKIEKKKYDIFHVYPSAIYLMAKIMKDNNLNLNHKFKAIMFGSEPLYDYQKQVIVEVFNSKLCYWYGHSEQAILAGNYPEDDSFYCYSQYGLTEVVDNMGKNVISGTGELIGTSFWNYATPFIRYKTADYATIEGGKKNKKQLKLSKIEGRLQEFIVTRDKKLISMTAINMHDDIFDDLLQFRFVQHTIGKVIFTYLPKTNKLVNVKNIEIRLKEKLGDNVELEVQEVNKIHRTKLGKLRFLDQKLDVSKYI